MQGIQFDYINGSNQKGKRFLAQWQGAIFGIWRRRHNNSPFPVRRRCGVFFLIFSNCQLQADHIPVNTGHINAGCIAFLSSCSANVSGSLGNVMESVVVPNHAGNVVTCQKVMMYSRFYSDAVGGHPVLKCDLQSLFPDIQEMITLLDALGINQTDYVAALDILSEQKDLQFD